MSQGPGAKPITPEAARIIREEHEHLRGILRQIESTESLDEMLPRLEELRGLLVPHFEHEETPDALGSAGSKPWLEDRAKELFSEHRLFLRTLDDLIRRAAECLEAPKPVLVAVRNLADALHEHETKENALILDLAETDLGGRG